MALRDSAENSDAGSNSANEADFCLIVGQTSAAGAEGAEGKVPHGSLLADLAAAVARWQWAEVAELRREGKKRLGAQQISDAILVAAGFNGITRVADAIGIRLDRRTADASVELRAEIGIDAFAPAQKWSL